MPRRYKFVFSLSLNMLVLVIYLPVTVCAADLIIKAKETHQTMVGFGAAIAWGGDQLASHPKKEEIYNYIFKDLGLDILRLRNSFRYGKVEDSMYTPQNVAAMLTKSEERPKILISSWSPEAGLKSNLSRENGGTIRKDAGGKFRYGSFAKYLTDAVTGYARFGVVADYISIQNEPNYVATWESCILDPTESTTNAGYDKALDSVYAAMQNIALHPQILGPEVAGIGSNSFQNYAQSFNRNHLDAYAYHLYNGGSGSTSSISPDAFKTNLASIANAYKDKPIFMSEYDYGDWLQTGWLIHNCIVDGNVSGYLWWQLVWGSGGKPLIEMQSSTYTISKYYWAFRQFSKYISQGWQRVTAESDTTTIKISAFVNPAGTKLTAVVINIGAQSTSRNINFLDFTVQSGKIICTTDTLNGAVTDSSFSGSSMLVFPARSITTLSLDGTRATSVDEQKLLHPIDFSLSQNYPNPFNPSTTIEYSVTKISFVTIKVHDVLGREIVMLVNGFQNSGIHSVEFDGIDTMQGTPLMSGVYFYTINVNGFTQTKKMILLK